MAQTQTNGRNGSRQQQAAREPDKRLPDFVVRVKVGDFWTTIGAAWTANLKDGVTGYSLKLNMIPMGWNGDGLLMPPLEDSK